MKKTMLFVLSLMLLTVFAVGCSTNDTTVTDTATDAPAVTVEAAEDTADDGNVTEDGTTDGGTDDTLGEDLDEAAGADDTTIIETTEAPAENTEG